jgi:transposase
MGHLFWLSDEAWVAIEPHSPKRQPGARRVDDRRVFSDILHVLKSGSRWRDCPSVYGPHTMIYNSFNRRLRRRSGSKFSVRWSRGDRLMPRSQSNPPM